MTKATRGASIAQARRMAAGRLREAGIESPDLDARLLVGHALGLAHAELVAAASRLLSAQEQMAIETLVARRLAHEPVARILGRKEFWSLPLRVSATTLVPRPETETLVEAALDAIAPTSRRQPMRILDLGTGSGAILLALLSELPQATGTGCDIDPLALDTARANTHDLGLANRCEFTLSDFGAGLTGAFDLVVSNPPYIASADLPTLPPEVRDHDPHFALDGGADGLACYRTIASRIGKLLAPGGLLALEIGAGQAGAVTAVFEAAGLTPAAPPRADLAGIPRALVFRALS
jgi:release factor glutamine methyltransferase